MSPLRLESSSTESEDSGKLPDTSRTIVTVLDLYLGTE